MGIGLASKYNLTQLKEYCLPTFIKNLKASNCLTMYNYAYKLDFDELKTAAFKILDENCSQRSLGDHERIPKDHRLPTHRFGKCQTKTRGFLKKRRKKTPKIFFHIIFFLFEKIFLSQRKFQFYDSTILSYARKKKSFFLHF